MTEAYLELIKHFDNDDIYVDHGRNCFVIQLNGDTHTVSKRGIQKFITKFVSNKNIKDGK